jgi:DNA-binding Lrp family transcriptional regulator
MITVGFVLMHVSSLHENEVFKNLLKLHEVIDLHPVFGEYDFIAKIVAKDYESIEEIVINKIKTIDGIIDTKTLIGTRLH